MWNVKPLSVQTLNFGGSKRLALPLGAGKLARCDAEGHLASGGVTDRQVLMSGQGCH